MWLDFKGVALFGQSPFFIMTEQKEKSIIDFADVLIVLGLGLLYYGLFEFDIRIANSVIGSLIFVIGLRSSLERNE